MNDTTNAQNPTGAAADNAQASTAATGLNTGNASDLNASQASQLQGASPGNTPGPALNIEALRSQQITQATNELCQTPGTDTEPEEDLQDVLEMYLKASEVRFKHLLNGMANTTAEMLRHLRDALVHLKDHIAQQNQPKE